MAARRASSCPAAPARGLNSTHTFIGGESREASQPQRHEGHKEDSTERMAAISAFTDIVLLRALRAFVVNRPFALAILARPAAGRIMVRMPEFANPEFLWLAPVAVLVGWWWARR